MVLPARNPSQVNRMLGGSPPGAPPANAFDMDPNELDRMLSEGWTMYEDGTLAPPATPGGMNLGPGAPAAPPPTMAPSLAPPAAAMAAAPPAGPGLGGPPPLANPPPLGRRQFPLARRLPAWRQLNLPHLRQTLGVFPRRSQERLPSPLAWDQTLGRLSDLAWTGVTPPTTSPTPASTMSPRQPSTPLPT
jgi:hypothetical protein